MEIIKYPHPCLRKKCKDVTRIDKELIDRVREMFPTMYENRGVGLAAPQVGWDARLFVVNVTGEPKDELVFINPIIVDSDGSIIEEEGCLSLPGLYGKVARADKVRMRAFDLQGEEFEIEAEGLLAVALQHERDHLDGTLFVMKLSQAGKIAAAPKLKEFEEQFKAEHPDSNMSCLT